MTKLVTCSTCNVVIKNFLVMLSKCQRSACHWYDGTDWSGNVIMLRLSSQQL